VSKDKGSSKPGMSRKIFDYTREKSMGLSTNAAEKIVIAAKKRIAELDNLIQNTNNPSEIEKLNKKKSKVQDELNRNLALLEKGTQAIGNYIDSKTLTADVESKVGELIESKLFGLSRVRFYSNGYVQVKKSAPELLIKITSADNTSSKTLPGRAISQGLLAIPTAGLSLMTGAVSPSRRGVLTLTIVTDVTAHVLSTNSPGDAELKAMYEIEGIGNSLIAKRQATNEAGSASRERAGVEPVTLSSELTKLSELLSQGVITQEEFDKAKSKLLS
jgi:hypothetical protein